MQSLGEAVLTLTTDPTRLKAGLAEAEGATATGMAKMKKAALGVSAVLVAGLVDGIYKSVKAATQFQSEMELIQTQAGASSKEVKYLSDGVLNLAGPTATAPEELAKGMYHLYSQGLKGAEGLKALKIAAEGAKVGQANLEDVTNALGAAMVSHIKGVQNVSSAMGALNATVGAGDMRMQDLADAMGTGLPSQAALAGVSLKDVSAALAVFGDNNIRGAKAGTQLNSMLRIMSAPSTAAAKALAEVGLSSTALADKMRGPGGLVSAFALLREKIKEHNLTASEAGVLLTHAFGGRQATGVKLLMDEFGRLKTKEEQVGKGADSFGASWKGTTETLSFKFDQIKASMQSFEISLGTLLIPVVEKLAKGLADVASWLTKHKAIAEILIGVVGTLAGSFLAITAATKAWSAIMLVLNTLLPVAEGETWSLNAALDANPIGAVVVAIGLLVGALVIAWKNSQTFRDVVTGVWNDVKSAVMTVVDFFTHSVPAAFESIVAWVRKHWPEIATLLSGPFAPLVGLATNAFGIRDKFTNALDDIKSYARRILDDVVGFFKDVPGKIGGAFSGLAGIMKGPIDTMIGAMNTIIGAIDAIKLPSVGFSIFGHHVGFGGWGGFQIPKIPMLAEGGIVTAPTLAMVGEAGREAVIPLDRGGPALGVTVNVSGVVGNERDVAVRIGRELQKLQDRGMSFGLT